MATSWRQQSLIAAPVEEVWGPVSDPARYPEWAERTIEVTGAPEQIEKGSTYRQTTALPGRSVTTTTASRSSRTCGSSSSAAPTGGCF